METTEEIKVITVDGTEYASVRTLSKMFDVDKKSVLAKLKDLQDAYSIDVLRWGDNTILVHLAQFRTALFRSSKPF